MFIQDYEFSVLRQITFLFPKQPNVHIKQCSQPNCSVKLQLIVIQQYRLYSILHGKVMEGTVSPELMSSFSQSNRLVSD